MREDPLPASTFDDGADRRVEHNIAHALVDRHVADGRGSHAAIRWLQRSGGVRQYDYREVQQRAGRLAAALSDLGVRRGDRVVTLLGRTPENHLTALAAFKLGAVFCPLFPAFGPDPLATRLERGRARVLVTDASLYRRKVEAQRSRLPDLRHVFLVSEDGSGDGPDTTDFGTALDRSPSALPTAPMAGADPALLHFTSGTTGTPKGAVHGHRAIESVHTSAAQVFDLRRDDVFWCTADFGWITGTSYGLIAPLSHGATLLVDEGDFDAARWCEVLEKLEVSVWYTAPTALRLLMRLGGEEIAKRPFPSLRCLASVGEPLDAECVRWSAEAFGQPVRDTWWQTETGSIRIAHCVGDAVRPGSMGRPLPGVEAAVVRRDKDGHLEKLDPDRIGELALRTPWPSLFQEYLDEPERYRRCFADDFYLTGDLVRKDADGFFWFVARDDDVIKSAGHLVGPFEVESALRAHPAVADVGVAGAPDPTTGQQVEAHVVVAAGRTPDDALKRELIAFARTRLGPALAPRTIHFRDALPKTPSGKTVRRELE